MNALLLPLSILCGLILCSTAVSLFAVYRAHCMLREMKCACRQAATARGHRNPGAP